MSVSRTCASGVSYYIVVLVNDVMILFGHFVDLYIKWNKNLEVGSLTDILKLKVWMNFTLEKRYLLKI